MSQATNIGNALLRQRETYITQLGTDVTLPNGTTRRAIVKPSAGQLIGSTRTDESGNSKEATIFVFGGSAWGVITENMRLTIGAGSNLRSFHVGDPLHPKWQQGIVTELMVAAWPD